MSFLGKFSKIKRNKETFLYVIGNYLYVAINAVSNLFISKLLGPAVLGVISYYNAIETNVNNFALGSVRSALERDVPQIKELSKKKSYAEKANTLNFLLLIAFSLMYSIIGLSSDNKIIEYSGYWVSFLNFIKGICDFLRIWHKSLFHIGQVAWVMIISSLLLPIIVIGLSYLYNYHGFWLGRILIQVITLCILLYWITKIGFSSIDFPFVKRVVISGGSLILFGLVQTVFQTADKFVLTYTGSLENLGYYSMGAMIFTMLLLLPQSIVGSIFPRFVAEQGVDKYSIIFKRSLQLEFLSLSISLLLLFLLPPIIRFVLPEYVQSIDVAFIFLIAFILNSNTQFKYIDIIRMDKMKKLLIYSFFVLIIGVVLYLLAVVFGVSDIKAIAYISVVNFTLLSFVINYVWNRIYKKSMVHTLRDISIHALFAVCFLIVYKLRIL